MGVDGWFCQMVQTDRKLFYKIGDVCRMCELEPHVLRYWEAEFTLLSPTKNRAGQRVYREKDLQLIEQIKFLLYERGYTIAGANRKLLDDETANLPLFSKSRVNQKKTVVEIRNRLQEILDIVDEN